MEKHRTSIEFSPDLWRELSLVVPERKKSVFITQAIREKLSRESIKALVICGGEGTRMRPLTLTIPKSMLPIGYRPILEHLVTFFKKEGILNFVFAIGYLGESIIKYFNDGSQIGINIKYSSEDKPLGTGGALKKAEDLLGSAFIVSNSDVIFDKLNIKELLKFHLEKNCVGTIVLWKAEDARNFGLVKADEDGKITSFTEKPKYAVSGWVNAGLYVFSHKVFDFISKNKFVSLENDVFPKLAEKGKLYGYCYNGYWADVGNPKDYEKVNRDLLTQKILQ